MSSRLSAESLKIFNSFAIGGKSALTKPNELSSALARPAMLNHYRPGLSTPRLAAELAWGIVMNHPFADGNKRTAFLAANEYLREKKHRPFCDVEPDVLGKHPEIMQAIGDSLRQVASSEMTADQLGEVFAKVLDEVQS